MTDRAGVEIDYCPQCRGVWLDRGELDKILERDQGGRSVAAPRRDDHDRDRERRYDDDKYKDGRKYEERYDHRYHGRPYKKKKTLLGEIFDF